MDDSKGKVIIFLWNLYVLFYYPLAFFSTTLWAFETSEPSPFGRGSGMPIAVMGVFVPEFIFKLIWNLNNRLFTIICSIVDGLILNRLFHLFFITWTDAPITYWILNIMIVLGLVWGIVIEFNQSLKEHILQYPENKWLYPHSEDEERDEIWQFLWKVLWFAALGCIFIHLIWGIFKYAPA
ncbi:MAG: hypothetical protein J1D87_04555 [Lachnospiraceae bacterium]|nr:hypothetical protein [Lachnospiraceae bacterium]